METWLLWTDKNSPTRYPMVPLPTLPYNLPFSNNTSVTVGQTTTDDNRAKDALQHSCSVSIITIDQLVLSKHALCHLCAGRDLEPSTSLQTTGTCRRLQTITLITRSCVRRRTINKRRTYKLSTSYV